MVRVSATNLREAWIVDLVVAMATVPDEIDDDVLLEVGAVLGRQLEDVYDGIDVVRVDVEDRRLERERQISAVRRGAARAAVGREANLIVDHHVHDAAGAVVGQVHQAHRLVHDALAGKRGVAVHEHRHGVRAVLVVRQVLQASV